VDGLLSRADLLWAGGIVLLAFALRLVWVLYSEADPTDGRFDDSVFYHLAARSVAETHSYTNPYSGLATAQWPPGYPIFLAGFYWLLGSSVETAKVVNAVLGAATALLVFVLALRLFDRRSARFAGLLSAVVPGQIFYASLVYSETLFTFLFVLGLLLIVTIQQRARWRWYWLAGLGLVAGAAGLTREIGLSLLLIAPVYWSLAGGSWQRSLRWTAVAALAGLALILPWTVRNFVALDSFVPISSSSGSNFWQGHHAGASGGWDAARAPFLEQEYGPRTRPGGEVDINKAGFRIGAKFALTHPLAEVKLTAEKLNILYRGDALGLSLNDDFVRRPFMPPALRRALRATANAVYYGVLLLAVLGGVRSIRQRRSAALLPAVTIVVVTAGTVVFFAQQRYHFALLPAFCVLAALGLAWGDRAGAALGPLLGRPPPRGRRAGSGAATHPSLKAATPHTAKDARPRVHCRPGARHAIGLCT
jgi:4-amino-4-deoxy-L-arabinose transferase-like glycosyltransferase